MCKNEKIMKIVKLEIYLKGLILINELATTKRIPKTTTTKFTITQITRRVHIQHVSFTPQENREAYLAHLNSANNNFYNNQH